MTPLDDSVKKLVNDNRVSLELFVANEMARDFAMKVLDVRHVWDTPEEHDRAQRIRDVIDRAEHETIYGDGTGEPKGILYANRRQRRGSR